MKGFTVFLFLLLCGVTGNLYGQDLGELEKVLSPALVGIQVDRSPEEELKALRKGKLYQAIGSGVIIDSEGLILTDNSLIPPDRSRVKVIFSNGTVRSGQIVSRDPFNQIALLKVSGHHSFLPMGNSRTLKIGDILIAAGNTYGAISRNFQCSITLGVLSDRYLLLHRKGPYRGVVLETTAGVNEGLFGGALVDRKGRLVGIISPSYSTVKWLGTAVPIHQIQLSLDYLKKGETPPAGRMGVALLQRGEIRGNRRVVVDELLPGGPAEQGGMKGRDILDQLEGQQITLLKQVDLYLAQLPGGSRVEVVVLRGNQRIFLTIELAFPSPTPSLGRLPRPDFSNPEEKKNPPVVPSKSPRQTAGKKVLGILLSRELASQGAFVRGVISGSSAHLGGILPGDQILFFNGQKVDSMDGAVGYLKKYSQGEMDLIIERGPWKKTFRLSLKALPEGENKKIFFPTSLKELGVTLDFQRGRVLRVQKGSHALFYGLQRGDEILSCNGNPLKGPGTLLKGKRISLQIRRDGWEGTISFFKP